MPFVVSLYASKLSYLKMKIVQVGETRFGVLSYTCKEDCTESISFLIKLDWFLSAPASHLVRNRSFLRFTEHFRVLIPNETVIWSSYASYCSWCVFCLTLIDESLRSVLVEPDRLRCTLSTFHPVTRTLGRRNPSARRCENVANASVRSSRNEPPLVKPRSNKDTFMNR